MESKKYHIGELFPDLTIKTAFHEDRKVSDVLYGKTIFWVLRYIGCPVCRLDVTLIAQRYREFVQKGSQVFVVMQSDKEHLRNSISPADLPFEIVCDSDQTFYKTLMIRPAASLDALAGTMTDKLQTKGGLAEQYGFTHGDYEGNELQLPAMFLVDENRKILYVHYATELADMPTIDDVLELL